MQTNWLKIVAIMALVIGMAVLVVYGKHDDDTSAPKKIIAARSLEVALKRSIHTQGAFVTVSTPDAKNKTATWVSRDRLQSVLGAHTVLLMDYWKIDNLEAEVRRVTPDPAKPQDWYLEVTFSVPDAEQDVSKMTDDQWRQHMEKKGTVDLVFYNQEQFVHCFGTYEEAAHILHPWHDVYGDGVQFSNMDPADGMRPLGMIVGRSYDLYIAWVKSTSKVGNWYATWQLSDVRKIATGVRDPKEAVKLLRKTATG